MKVQIRIISQTVLANADKLPTKQARLKVYGSCDVTLPEPFGGRDFYVRLDQWLKSYSRILNEDRSAVIKIVPYVDEMKIPF